MGKLKLNCDDTLDSETKKWYWQRFVDEYDAHYEGSCSAFCRDHGLSSRAFYYWYRRLSAKAKDAEEECTFARVLLTPETSALPKENLKIRLPNGLSVELPVTLDDLRKVLEVCRRCC